MTRQGLLVLFETLTFLCLIVFISFRVDVHYLIAGALGGLLYLLIRLLLLVGYSVTHRAQKRTGQFWKRHGGWGEFR